MKNKNWTEEEDNILIESLQEGKLYKDIMVESRTEKAVISRISYLISKNRIPSRNTSTKWTPEEEAKLTELRLSNTPILEISKILGRTEEAIRSRLKKLRIKNSSSGNFNWSKEEEDLLANNMDLSYKEIASMLGRTEGSVATKAKRMGLARVFHGNFTDEQLLAVVRKYRSRDALKYSKELITAKMVEHRFGGWKEALRIAGLDQNECSLLPNKDTILYLVDFGEFKKVGITQRTIKDRFRDGYINYKILDFVTFSSLEDALDAEREILSNMEKYKYIPEDFNNGKTECFKFDCTLLEEII